MEGGSLLFLPACSNSCWQVHLTCCWGTPSLALEPSSGFQCTLRTSGDIRIPDWTATGFCLSSVRQSLMDGSTLHLMSYSNKLPLPRKKSGPSRVETHNDWIYPACLILITGLFANLSNWLWWWFNHETGQLYVKLQFFCAVFKFGQRFIFFGNFSLDKHLNTIPFKRRYIWWHYNE